VQRHNISMHVNVSNLVVYEWKKSYLIRSTISRILVTPKYVLVSSIGLMCAATHMSSYQKLIKWEEYHKNYNVRSSIPERYMSIFFLSRYMSIFTLLESMSVQKNRKLYFGMSYLYLLYISCGHEVEYLIILQWWIFLCSCCDWHL